MKRIIIISILSILSVTGIAQEDVMTIEKRDGRTLKIRVDDISNIEIKSYILSDNLEFNTIFNQLCIGDLDVVNGKFDFIVYKAYHNTILDCYTNGIMIRYKLNGKTVGEWFLVKDYGTLQEAKDNLTSLSTYSYRASASLTLSYSLDWDKVEIDNGLLRFESVKLNPDFVKVETEYGDFISDGLQSFKRILWLGTSIPRGGYPEMVGAILGCKVYNEAEGESLCRLGWGNGCRREGDVIDIWGCDINTHIANPLSNTITALAKSLSASKAEKRYLLDNLSHFEEVTGTKLERTRYTDEAIMAFSYEEKILKYVDANRNDYTPVDLIVFDHGHNDLNPDGIPAWDSHDIANTNKDNYWGAMNFLIDVIKKYQPNIPICQVSHYYGWENYTGNGNVEKIWNAQKQIADYNGMVFCPLYKFTGYSGQRRLRTNGYWSQYGIWHPDGFFFQVNSNGTITTNSYTIAKDYNLEGSWTGGFFTSTAQANNNKTIYREITKKTGEESVHYLMWPKEAAFPDMLHPVSDTSTNSLKKIATLLAGWLSSYYHEIHN